MKLLALSLWLLLHGQSIDAPGGKRIDKRRMAYSAKADIGYSAKSAKEVVVDPPEPWPDVLQLPPIYPQYHPLPPTPINPKRVTEINPTRKY